MISSALFTRYTRALVDIVMERHEEPRVTSELQTYREIFLAVPDLLPAFDSPAVPRDVKEKILDRLLELHPVGTTTANFLRVLLQHNRILHYVEIFDSYLRSVNARKGVVAARVTAATALSDNDLAGLRAALRKATGLEVTLDVNTDPDLIGGLVVRVGSTVYDGSVRSQLDEMRRRLAEG